MIKLYLPGFKILALTILFTACNTPRQGVFSRSTGHEKKNEKKNEEFSLKPKVKRKISPDDRALNNPLTITLPYKETSYIEDAEMPANGYLFTARKGQQLRITVISANPSKDVFYTQVWEKTGTNEPLLIGSANAGRDTIAFDFEKDGKYIVRVEAEKTDAPEYTVMITTAPSLSFPINKKDKPRVSSFWGASRDNGKRSHEGIDIVARKYTPLVAVADGYITAVKNGGLGGKTVSLRPVNKDYSVYYAHLDQQYVSTGQFVHTGDTIGTVGNTGNAAKTVPHLHFGIYTISGPIDPLAFIQENNQPAKEVMADVSNIRGFAKLKISTPLYSKPSTLTKKSMVSMNKVVKLLGATDNYYRVRLDDGEEGFILSSTITKERIGKDSKEKMLTSN